TGTGVIPALAPLSPLAQSQPGLVYLTWAAATPGAWPLSAYAIYRASCPSCAAVETGTVSSSTFEFGDASVSPGNTYTYAIRAIDQGGNGGAFSFTVTGDLP